MSAFLQLLSSMVFGFGVIVSVMTRPRRGLLGCTKTSRCANHVYTENYIPRASPEHPDSSSIAIVDDTTQQ